MLHTTALSCPYCSQNDSAKNGKTSKGVQRWQCNRCKKYFQLAYKYIARKQEIKEKIIEQTLNSSGVRDTGRVLGISKDTVTSVLKKNSKSEPLLSYYRRKSKIQNLEIEIKCTSEMDEFWSYVQNKTNQRWTSYAVDKKSGCILAWHNWKRQDKDFLVLWELLKPFNIERYYTNDWGSYSKYIPSHQHQISKDETWKIERKNLNFRS